MIKITDDVFDVARRIKDVNEEYELFYDNKQRRFAVYVRNKLEITLPYDSLDKRSVDYVLKTQIKNIERIQYEIDEHNRRLMRARKANLNDKKDYKLRELKRYIENGRGDFTFYENI